MQQQEKEALLADLQESEDWLYSEEGEDATKSAYVSRLDALKKLGDPINARWKEAETRSAAVAQLRETINTYAQQAQLEDEKYSHIDPNEKQSIVEKCATVQKWLDDQLARQAERPKNVDPVITCADVLKKKDEIIYFASPILNKPKPKPPKVESTGTPNGPESKSRTDTPNPEAEQAKADPKVPSEMDVD